MQVIYIGPTIPGLVERNRIYLGHLPEEVTQRRIEDPYFGRLFVPVDQLITARQEMETPGSVLAVSFKKVSESLKG